MAWYEAYQYHRDDMKENDMIYKAKLFGLHVTLETSCISARNKRRLELKKTNAVRPPPLKESAVEEGTPDASTAPLTGEAAPTSRGDTEKNGAPFCTICEVFTGMRGHYRPPCQSKKAT